MYYCRGNDISIQSLGGIFQPFPSDHLGDSTIKFNSLGLLIIYHDWKQNLPLGTGDTLTYGAQSKEPHSFVHNSLAVVWPFSLLLCLPDEIVVN